MPVFSKGCSVIRNNSSSPNHYLRKDTKACFATIMNSTVKYATISWIEKMDCSTELFSTKTTSSPNHMKPTQITPESMLDQHCSLLNLTAPSMPWLIRMRKLLDLCSRLYRRLNLSGFGPLNLFNYHHPDTFNFSPSFSLESNPTPTQMPWNKAATYGQTISCQKGRIVSHLWLDPPEMEWYQIP